MSADPSLDETCDGSYEHYLQNDEQPMTDTPRTTALERLLRKSLNSLDASYVEMLEHAQGLETELIAALSESAKWKADAGRYRWLREIPNADALNLRYMGVDLDMIIDEAMKRKKP